MNLRVFVGRLLSIRRGGIYAPLLALALVLATTPARGLIHAATPPDSLYSSCPTVITGTITKFTADTGNIEATAQTLKGTPVGDVIRFKLQNLPEIAARVKVGEPLVLFVAHLDRNAALHLADTWLAPAKAGPSTFLVSAEKDLRQSYPGTTAALHRLVTGLKDGKYDMLNAVSPNSFKGSIKELGKLDAPGAHTLFAARLGSDKQSTLIAASATAAKSFSLAPDGFHPATTPPPALTDVIAVAAAEFPIGTTGAAARTFLSLKKDGTLTAGDPAIPTTPGATPLKLWANDAPASCAAIGSFADQGKLAALVVRDTDVFLYPIDPSADPKTAPAPLDFLRLTGERLSTYFKGDKPLAGASAAPLDVNGDGRMDLLIHTPQRDLLLINRGYGSFFINADIGKILVDPAGKPLLGDKTPWTAVDVDGDGNDDLLILSESGAVSALLNPKPEK